MKNILEFLEKNAVEFKDKTAFIDSEDSVTYGEVLKLSKRIGTAVSGIDFRNRPVVIYMDKSVRILSSMFGITYSGNFYVVVDSEMPIDRINKIFATLNPVAIITDEKYLDNASRLDFSGEIFIYSEAVKTEINDEALAVIKGMQIDTDPLYALFTSGSTGMPKGAVVSHKSVIAYSQWSVETFDINSETVFANQTPFYFSMSVTDIYSTLRTGASLVIIPKIYFSFPMKLVELLNEYKVNTIYWEAVCNFNRCEFKAV